MARPRRAAAAALLALGCTRPEVCAPLEPPDAGAADAGVLRFEQCDNGRDDDDNGLVDDGCPCAYGDVRACSPLPSPAAGTGVCTLGTTRCRAERLGSWSACEGAGMPEAEACANGLDDDCDARIDEGCPCELGATQPCFPGGAGQAGIGVCAAGVQACAMHGEFAGFGACEGATGPSPEVCNGLDDDCDGEVDERPEICNGADDDCDGEVDEGTCRGVRYLSRYWPATHSDILTAAPLMYAATSDAPAMECPPGTIPLEHRPGELQCAPEERPECPAGTQADWTGERWECVACQLLVQFGFLFDYERACAPPPPEPSCPCGEVPTFDVVTRAWGCAPICDDTLYDRVALPSGATACVPC